MFAARLTSIGGLLRSRSRGTKDTNGSAGKRPASRVADNPSIQDNGHPATQVANANQFSDSNSVGSGGSPGNSAQDNGHVAAPQAVAPPRPLTKDELEVRQQEEKDFIQRSDTAESGVWYIVDVRWLQEWKHFVTKGGRLPGPIDNSRLVDNRGMAVKGLKPVDDYRGVNFVIWSFWHQRYGGGPVVRRKQLDLYAAAADDPENQDSIASWSSDSSSVPLPGSTRQDGASSHRDRGSSRRSGTVPGVERLREEDEDDEDGEQDPPSSRRGSSMRVGGERSPSSPQGEEEARDSPPSRGRMLERPRAGEKAKRGKSMPAPQQEKDTKAKALCCDKCDGPHETDKCPHFRKAREKHADAWTSYGTKKNAGAGVGSEGAIIIKNARVVPQPGDGSCLFHSLSYGLKDGSSATTLRREICNFIEKNKDLSVADTPMKDWVKYDSGGTVQSYADSMRGGTWGGGIEMAALVKMRAVNVHVYEKCREGYRRISAFEAPAASKTVSVLYQGRMHYDAIIV